MPDPNPSERLAEIEQELLGCFAIPPPITSETLRLLERALLEPSMFSYEWWAQRGVIWSRP